MPHVTQLFSGEGTGTKFLLGGGEEFRSLIFPTQYLLVLLLKGVWRQCVSVCEECKTLGREVLEYERARKLRVLEGAL